MRRIAAALVFFLALPALAGATEPPRDVAAPTSIPPSIHQRELEAHRGLPEPPVALRPQTFRPTTPASTPRVVRTVFGFLPYWVENDLSTIRWDLLTHVAHFSAELSSDGSISALHGWPNGTYVAPLLSTAHANGVKVVLAATLFGSSGIGTLLGSSTYRQNTINNLLAQVQAAGADGVNIDFETVPLAQKANFVTFIQNLTSAFHAAIPGSHVSIDTPAVDWAGAYDYDALALASDGLFIMAYDYHWSTSTQAGPVSPLTSGSTWSSRDVTWTVNDYMTYGGSANRGKFLLGVPYYGQDWPTTSLAVPSSTTGSASAKYYSAAKPAAASHGRLWDADSQTPYYLYNSGTPHQGWYDDEVSLGLKWDLVNAQDLGGTGMWALNYDTLDSMLWDSIEAHFVPASLAGLKVGLDAGHGGSDPGAIGPTGLAEKSAALGTALRLREALESAGAWVLPTRLLDVTVPLTSRADYLDSIPVDRTISVHFRSSADPASDLSVVRVLGNDVDGSLAGPSADDLASKSASRISAALGLGAVATNCALPGVHADPEPLLAALSMPSVLAEASTITNGTEEGLLAGESRRCQVAGALARALEDHAGVAALSPPCASVAVGTCSAPIEIPSFPFADSNTTSGKGASLDGYSCPPSSGSEAGPEVVYRLTIPSPGNLTVTVTDGPGVDIDPQLLRACDPASCLARNDTTFTVALAPGSYLLVCDSWTSAGGTQYPGAYTLNVTFSATSGDQTSPASPQDLKFSAGSWRWSAPALDRLGNPEMMGSYELWQSMTAPSTGVLLATTSATSLADAAVPASGCWYYRLRAIDAAGNRDTPARSLVVDNPQATFAGTWSTGTTAPGHYGSDYRFVPTGGASSNKALWYFTPEESGVYDVFVWYPSDPGASAAARYSVFFSSGSTLVTVDQRKNGGTWVPLGSWWFDAATSNRVVLDDGETDGIRVFADAIQLVRRP